MFIFVTPRLKILTIIAATALALLACLPGCAATPTQRWAEARIALNTVQNSLVDLNANGLLSDEDFVATRQFVKPARAALDAAEAQLPEGSGTFVDLLTMANAAVTELQRIETAGIAAQTPATARPPPATP